jgi:hypothetical protein
MLAGCEIFASIVRVAAAKRVWLGNFRSVLFLAIKIQLDFLDRSSGARYGHNGQSWSGTIEADNCTILQVGKDLARGGKDQLKTRDFAWVWPQANGIKDFSQKPGRQEEQSKEGRSDLHGVSCRWCDSDIRCAGYEFLYCEEVELPINDFLVDSIIRLCVKITY